MLLKLDTCQQFQPIATESKVEGVPSRKFRKEVIRIGEYEKDEVKFEVTALALDNWVKQFRRMKRNGVKVPIPSVHDFEGDSDKNRGWVTDFFVEGESLFMVCDLIGEDSLLAAERADVSLYSPPDFVDGKGNNYSRPIVHVAMTTHPVIPGLKKFEPLVASLENKMDLEKLGKALKLDLTKEKAEDQIVAAFGTLAEELKKAKEKPAPKADPKKPAPDATLLSLAADNRTMKLSQLVAAGKITPAVSDKLMAIYIGEGNAALILSLQENRQGDFDALVLALSENDPVKLAETTGGQVLSNPLKAKENPLIADAEARAKAV